MKTIKLDGEVYNLAFKHSNGDCGIFRKMPTGETEYLHVHVSETQPNTQPRKVKLPFICPLTIERMEANRDQNGIRPSIKDYLRSLMPVEVAAIIQQNK